LKSRFQVQEPTAVNELMPCTFIYPLCIQIESRWCE